MLQTHCLGPQKSPQGGTFSGQNLTDSEGVSRFMVLAHVILAAHVMVLGKGSKTPITALCRDGGGGTPLCRDFFSVNFLAGRLPGWGGGYPPLL